MTGLGKALVVLTLAVFAPHHQQPSNHVPGCSKTYTVFMVQRATIAVYSRPHVSTKDRTHIGWLERCQRDLRFKPFLDSYVSRWRAIWLERHPPAPILSALAQCIIRHESGGNPRAINGKYEGLGQWSPSSWTEFGGQKYGKTPLDATAIQQETVLMNEGPAGQADQQGQYDGCSS